MQQYFTRPDEPSITNSLCDDGNDFHIDTIKLSKEQHKLAHTAAKDKVIAKMYHAYMELKIQHEPDTLTTDKITANLISSLQQLVERTSTEKEKTNHVWVTINPKPDVSLEQLINVVEKIITKKWVTEYVYVYEQRGTDMDTLGTGFHAHLLLPKSGKTPSHIKQELYSTSKHIVGHQKHVHTVFITDSQVEPKIKYMLGHKTADDKAIKTEMDKVWRKQHEFEPIYYEGYSVSSLEGEEASASAASEGPTC